MMLLLGEKARSVAAAGCLIQERDVCVLLAAVLLWRNGRVLVDRKSDGGEAVGW